jgi:hypothetical protein
MRNILRKIKLLTERQFSLSMFLHITNLGYIYRRLIDQPFVKKKSKDRLSYFRSNLFPSLGIVAQTFTAEKEIQKNLELVVKCLDSANIKYFVVPDPLQDTYKVGIATEDRSKFFNALSRRYSNTGVYIATENKLLNSFSKRQLISSRRSLKRFHEANVVRIYSFVLSPDYSLLAGDAEGCNVEFWEKSDNENRREYLKNKLLELRVNIELDLLNNTLVAPNDNNFSGVLPLDEVKVDSMNIGGKKYRTYDVFNKKTINDIDFPIDIVYAWVDGNDPKWKAKFNKYKGVTADLSERNNTESRYKDRQELKYSLRSVHMYAPFVRNIYIVTDGQVPEWLNKSVPGIKVVDHKDIFSDPSVLPVFNSHAIGTQVHNIKGLSDRYLYLNDDMMFGRLITPQKFFYSSGVAKVAASPALIHAGSPKDYEPAPSSGGKNVRKALEKSFGRYITHKFKHSPNPQIKEVIYEIEKRYPDIVKQTMRSRFRNKTDLQFASQFHHSYSLITGRAVTASMRSAVVNISEKDARAILDDLLKKRDAYTLCLNESETPKNRQAKVEKMVHDFFELYYPYPSPWEKP